MESFLSQIDSAVPSLRTRHKRAFKLSRNPRRTNFLDLPSPPFPFAVSLARSPEVTMMNECDRRQELRDASPWSQKCESFIKISPYKSLGSPFSTSAKNSGMDQPVTCPRRFGPASTYDMGNCLLSDTNTLDMDDLSDAFSARHCRQSLREDCVGALDGVDVCGVDGGQLPPH